MIQQIVLIEDEQQVTVPVMERLTTLRNEMNHIITTMQPVVSFLCKLHKVNPEHYALAEDGKSLLCRVPQQAEQSPVTSQSDTTAVVEVSTNGVLQCCQPSQES